MSFRGTLNTESMSQTLVNSSMGKQTRSRARFGSTVQAPIKTRDAGKWDVYDCFIM